MTRDGHDHTCDPGRGGRSRTKSPEPRIRTLLIEDDESLTRAVSRALRGHGVEVVGAATLAAARALLAEDGQFGAAIVDLALPDGDGASLLPLLRRLEIRTIVLSGFYDSDRAPDLAAWDAFGVSKPIRLGVLLRLLRTLVSGCARSRALFTEIHDLSPTQGAILAMASDGRGPLHIARTLGCSPETIEEHWRRIASKLDAASRESAVAAYRRFIQR